MANCFYCNQPANLLCDGHVMFLENKRLQRGTCDRPLCSNCRAGGSVLFICARPRSQSRTATIDFCPECAPNRGRKGESFNQGTLANA